MKYKISKEALDILNTFDESVSVYMQCCLDKYFKTGKNPQFNSPELRDLWFYLKVHELADNIQKDNTYYKGYYGTFNYIELRSILSKNSYKFINKTFRVGGAN